MLTAARRLAKIAQRRVIVTSRRSLLLCAAILSLSITGMAPNGVRAVAPALPERLTDQDYWSLVSELSEPDGEFRSDNLLSNEIFLQYVIPDLLRGSKLNRVYLGVGPEQNFTYIAALKPKMAFIVDVRRGNLQLHLMYKALFELSSDRADFIFRLFSRKRPEGLTTKSTADEIFAAVHKAAPDKAESTDVLYKQNLKLLQDHLTRTRRLPLTPDDLKGIEYVYGQFSWYGPGLSYWSTGGRGGGRDAPTYWDLMVAEDGKGQNRSFLASEDNFLVLKELHQKNLLVPVVGNFAGPKAIRSVGRYLREREAVVSAFYLSNVEQYLTREGTLYSFICNVATLPLDASSLFIRSVRDSTFGPGVGLDSRTGNMPEEVKACAAR
jgi:hypothetical protein